MPWRHWPTAHRRRTDGECGAALLEAAFVAPLVILLLFAVLEGGVAFFERLTVANMSLAGARSGSGQGSEALADYQLLRAMRTGSGMDTERINTVVVYRATGPADTVPNACRSASVASLCNRYVAADIVKDVAHFGCTGPPGPETKIDAYWCATARKTAISGPGGPPDYIGVYVEVLHRDLTGILGDGIVLRSDSIMRMEPRTLT